MTADSLAVDGLVAYEIVSEAVSEAASRVA
jgi:hypothetical protein